jgi:predicted 3-demethylubiquinone-9 3-methyltransferase (glyoxalase superfamily)
MSKMTNARKKGRFIQQFCELTVVKVVAPILVTLIVGGTAPWWWEKTPWNNISSLMIALPNGSQVDLFPLSEQLREQNFEAANTETKRLLFAITNSPSSNDRFSKGDSQKIDCQGLKKIDELWKKYSHSKFGLSVQKNIFLDVQDWNRFSEKVGWRLNGKLVEDRGQLNYNLDAPIGHLPGTLFWITQDSDFYAGISSCNI